LTQSESLGQDALHALGVGVGKLAANAGASDPAGHLEELGTIQSLHRGRRSSSAEDALPVDVVNKLLGRFHALSSGGAGRSSRKRSKSGMRIKSRKRIKSKNKDYENEAPFRS